jgi:hypothetical protein
LGLEPHDYAWTSTADRKAGLDTRSGLEKAGCSKIFGESFPQALAGWFVASDEIRRPESAAATIELVSCSAMLILKRGCGAIIRYALRAIVNEALGALEPEFAALCSPIGRPSIPPEKQLRARCCSRPSIRSAQSVF